MTYTVEHRSYVPVRDGDAAFYVCATSRDTGYQTLADAHAAMVEGDSGTLARDPGAIHGPESEIRPDLRDRAARPVGVPYTVSMIYLSDGAMSVRIIEEA